MATSPSTQTRTRLSTIINTVFAAEGIATLADKLDDSLGQEGPVAAVSPIRESESGKNAMVLETDVLVQVFAKYDAEINEFQKVNPAAIEAWAQRLKEGLKGQEKLNDPACWYFRVLEVDYPDDPTGNKTRFTMRIRAFGSHSAVV